MDIVLVVFRIVGILRLVADVRFVVRHVVQVAAGFGYGVADVDAGQVFQNDGGIGMLSTLMNAIALADVFNDAGLPTRALSTVEINVWSTAAKSAAGRRRFCRSRFAPKP